MGERGPKATPTAIRKARGTDRPRDRAKSEPAPRTGRPRCPAWLDKGAKACWKELIPELEAMGVLTRAERWALTLYCRLWSRWRAAEESLMKHGSTYALKDSSGKVRFIGQRPEVSIARSLAQQLTRLGAELGLSPSARTRIEAKPPEDKSVDNGTRFFGVVG